MSKIRIYEYAREQNISSKEIIEMLKRLGHSVANHMSVIEESQIKEVENYMNQLKNGEQTSNKQKEVAREQTTQNKAQKSTNTSKGTNTQSNNNSNKHSNNNRKPGNSTNAQQKQGTQNKASVGTQQNKSKPSTPSNSKNVKSKDAKNDEKEFAGSKEKTKKTKAHDKHFNDDKSVPANKKRRNKIKHQRAEAAANQDEVSHLVISGPITVGELGKKLGKEPSEIIKKLLFLGVMATINQELDIDAISLIAEEYGVTVEEKIEVDEDQFELFNEEDDPATLKERPPVVTVMGHVDHGKTTLLDAIRHTSVTSTEAGGITQHIGAYQVEYNEKQITFLDTPGHAAFTTMRARGAQVTDIAIIVVAADDGVMPQTKEAVAHAQAAEVPIIVAVNKMDKEDANPDRVKQELTELNLVPEDWGGDTIFVHVSALKNEGLDDLMEMILLVSEVNEYKANPDRLALGTVIEAELDKGRGPVATVLVQSGTLQIGDSIVIGNTYGRVRAMVNDKGRRVKTAAPSMPIEIIGMHDVPQAGDSFKVYEDEKKARSISEKRSIKQREQELGSNAKVSLDELFQQIQEGEIKDLNVIIKGDVQGSVEALKGSLEKIEVEGVRVKIILTGVGAITEYDIMLASASNAIVIGFNVRPEPNARVTAEQEKVDVRLHRIIYNVIDEIESGMRGLLDPEYQEKVLGTAEVRQIFKVSKVGTIAGSYVTEGKITRDSSVRLIREGIVIHEGKVDVLKRFKDDVKEVQTNYECGITLEGFHDIKEGDMIEAYIMEEIPR
ncbi:translation initiation factor IF-2 [Bacillus horti]|uniref:Translation initiation factor IF-2 n=1 Tax=Caldalkalibacillus horti TaxID=77523 RepID=A0ABT9VUN9_9BACI|nr:translation initiation factor IF-2 [Bacillus horti]MDQ0164708.1 translation initiation factor IF-2 [Bacillus horti]